MKLKNTSASQVTAWNECPRFWHFGWVRGFKEPPSAAMQRGTYIHAAAEHLQKTGKLPDDEWAVYAKSMEPHLPIGQEKVLVEHKFWLDTQPGLPKWLGYIDLLDDSRTLSKHLRITDHKTTSDFRYAKTPEELRKENPQLNAYARFVFENGHDEDIIEVGHLYVKTAKKTPKKPKVLPVYTEISRADVQKRWDKDLISIEQMVIAAELNDTDRLEPKGVETGRCKKYGGCPHRSRCGFSEPLSMFNNGSKSKITNQKGNQIMSDFLKRLEAAAEGAAADSGAKDTAEKTTEETAEGTPNEGVLASDAASRETEVETKDGADGEEPTKKKTTKKGSTKKKTSTKSTNGRKEFALYIDCVPQKFAELEPSLFEDWIAPVRDALNEEVMKKKQVPDYRLLPYAEEKALFSMAVNERLKKDLPPAMVVMSMSPGAKDALEILIPHSTQLVRGLR